MFRQNAGETARCGGNRAKIRRWSPPQLEEQQVRATRCRKGVRHRLAGTRGEAQPPLLADEKAAPHSQPEPEPEPEAAP